MTLIGYARISTREQNADGQHDALTKAGCERIFTDKASGKLANRPELDRCLDYVRPGDTLVITKLDRLGRSVKNLIELAEKLKMMGVDLRVLHQGIDTSTPGGRLFFHMVGAFAEFERDLISERTLDGLEAARARGRHGGRRPKMTETKLAAARDMYASKCYTVQQIADTIGVSRATLYRHLEPVGPEMENLPLVAVQHVQNGRPQRLFHAADPARGPLHVLDGEGVEYKAVGDRSWWTIPVDERCSECVRLAGAA